MWDSEEMNKKNTLERELASIFCLRAKPDNAAVPSEFPVSLWIVQRTKNIFFIPMAMLQSL